MKALILCAGKGTRLAPLSNSMPKQIIPIANRPIIYFVLDLLVSSNIKKIGIVVSPENIDKIVNAVGNGNKWGVKISYIVQRKPLGLAHAVKESRQFLKDSHFILVLGDNLIKDNLNSIISKYKHSRSDALIVLREVKEPKRFGVVELDDKGKIIKMVEKPREPKSNLAILGLYIFNPIIHKAIDRITPSWRGEYEITDAIQNLLDAKYKIDYYIYKGFWQDIGNPDDLLGANKNTISTYTSGIIKSKIDTSNNIEGKLNIGENVIIKSSSIIGPSVIGDNCKIINSRLGPYISIGNDTTVQNSSLENCIVLNNCRIENINDLSNSVIGRHSRVFRGENGEKTRRVIIGDRSKKELY
jgi:glucose-1-phosphate thymidylyltransferase